MLPNLWYSNPCPYLDPCLCLRISETDGRVYGRGCLCGKKLLQCFRCTIRSIRVWECWARRLGEHEEWIRVLESELKEREAMEASLLSGWCGWFAKGKSRIGFGSKGTWVVGLCCRKNSIPGGCDCPRRGTNSECSGGGSGRACSCCGGDRLADLAFTRDRSCVLLLSAGYVRNSCTPCKCANCSTVGPSQWCRALFGTWCQRCWVHTRTICLTSKPWIYT